ncbi:MAG: WecB/TagA/CpsF family glycosyltransferase [Gemmatimonadetes bacterium]|nr:WecB/TagA/CpsF family glycosyltransferase [Gemmatimonadota bacterium]
MGDLRDTAPEADIDGVKYETFRFGTLLFTRIRRADLKPLVSGWAARQPAPSMTMTLTGAHGLTESRVNPEIQAAHEDADIVLCDGTPPWLGAVIHGHARQVDRIPGRDAMREIASAAADIGLKQAFIGGPPGLAERTVAGLELAIGRPIDALPWSPPFVERVDDAYADIVAAKLGGIEAPVVVWIGLSTPKQEMLAERLRKRLPHGFFFVAVGAAFDMYAGTRPPPPPIVSRLGVEWLYRSFQEPRRLPARYARALPVVAIALGVAAWRRLTRS